MPQTDEEVKQNGSYKLWKSEQKGNIYQWHTAKIILCGFMAES